MDNKIKTNIKLLINRTILRSFIFLCLDCMWILSIAFMYGIDAHGAHRTGRFLTVSTRQRKLDLEEKRSNVEKMIQHCTVNIIIIDPKLYHLWDEYERDEEVRWWRMSEINMLQVVSKIFHAAHRICHFAVILMNIKRKKLVPVRQVIQMHNQRYIPTWTVVCGMCPRLTQCTIRWIAICDRIDK